MADLELVIEGRRRDLGGGMVVTRLLPAARRRMVGPFVFLDHLGPITLPPGVGFDVPPHPHIGLSTVTYFLAGTNVHRDSLGTVQTNRPFDAGRGVVHSERAEPAFRASGGLMHGVQIWLALPDSHEDVAPSFEHHPAASLPAIAPAEGVTGKLLIGRAHGARSPIAHPSDPLLVELVLAPGARLVLEAGVAERAVFVVEGSVALGGQPRVADQLVVLGDAAVELVAETASRVMVLGGPALPTRFIDWNFVASSRERIAQAVLAWKQQAFPRIPDDHDDFTPYPELGR